MFKPSYMYSSGRAQIISWRENKSSLPILSAIGGHAIPNHPLGKSNLSFQNAIINYSHCMQSLSCAIIYWLGAKTFQDSEACSDSAFLTTQRGKLNMNVE